MCTILFTEIQQRIISSKYVLSNILALKKSIKTKWLKRTIVALMTLNMKSSPDSDSELVTVSLK